MVKREEEKKEVYHNRDVSRRRKRRKKSKAKGREDGNIEIRKVGLCTSIIGW